MVLGSRKQEVMIKLFTFSSFENHSAYKFSHCLLSGHLGAGNYLRRYHDRNSSWGSDSGLVTQSSNPRVNHQRH